MWARDLADPILLDIQFLKGCEVEWKSLSHQPPPNVSTLAFFRRWSCCSAAAADDDAPRRSNRSPQPNAGVAAKFEDRVFSILPRGIYNDGSIPMDRFRFSRDALLAFLLHFHLGPLPLLNIVKYDKYDKYLKG